jgi:hypothetical protein
MKQLYIKLKTSLGMFQQDLIHKYKSDIELGLTEEYKMLVDSVISSKI